MWSDFINKIKIPEWLRVNKKMRRSLLCCAVLIVANLVLYAFVVSPSTAQLQALQARHSELRKRQADAVLFEKQKSLFAGISSGIPTQNDMPVMIKEVVQTARKLNLKVGPVNYDIPKQGGGNITMLSIPFSAEGSYPSIKRFVYEMESSDRLIGIQDVKLSSGQHHVKLDMKVIAYIKGR